MVIKNKDILVRDLDSVMWCDDVMLFDVMWFWTYSNDVIDKFVDDIDVCGVQESRKER